MTGGGKIAFRFLKGQVDRNNAISEARSNARSNKPEQNTTKDNKPEQKATNSPKEKEKEKDKEKEKEKKRGEHRFTPPTVEEVAAYCRERGNSINPEYFVDYYAARGWVLSNGKQVRDWRACVRTWEQRERERKQQKPAKQVVAQQYEQRDYSGEDKTLDEDMLELMRM